MAKTKTKRKILTIACIVVALLVTTAIFYFLNEDRNRPNLVGDWVGYTEQNSKFLPGNDSSRKTEESPNAQANQTNELSPYRILDLNIKKGEKILLPREIVFSVSPKVDFARVTLKNSNGNVLYKEEKGIMPGAFIINPATRDFGGGTGLLVLEGLVDNKIVVTEKVEVGL